jgi:hypothetical protein
VADRAASNRTGIRQRSRSFRQLAPIAPGGLGYDAGGNFGVLPPVWGLARVHQHDNNAEGGVPVVHFR